MSKKTGTKQKMQQQVVTPEQIDFENNETIPFEPVETIDNNEDNKVEQIVEVQQLKDIEKPSKPKKSRPDTKNLYSLEEVLGLKYLFKKGLKEKELAKISGRTPLSVRYRIIERDRGLAKVSDEHIYRRYKRVWLGDEDCQSLIKFWLERRGYKE